MYKFAGYTVRVNDGFATNFFPSREKVIEAMQQNGNVNEKDIVQLFYFQRQEYVEPKEKDGIIES